MSLLKNIVQFRTILSWRHPHLSFENSIEVCDAIESARITDVRYIFIALEHSVYGMTDSAFREIFSKRPFCLVLEITTY